MRLIRLPEVIHLTGYKRTALYKKIDQGDFPRPVKLGPRAVAWIENEVMNWIKEKIQTRDSNQMELMKG